MTYLVHLKDDWWDRICGILPGTSGDVGRAAKDNRLFVEGVDLGGAKLWSLARLPQEYGQLVKCVQTLVTLGKGYGADDFQHAC